MKKLLLLLITFCLFIAAPMQQAKAASPALADASVMGFEHIDVPANISNDEFIIKALYFAMKEEAGKVKNIKLSYSHDAAEDCYVTGVITAYDWSEVWHSPSAHGSTYTEWSKDYKWTDDKGKEKKKTVSRKNTGIVNDYGYYSFDGVVEGTFYLVKYGSDEVLVTYSDRKVNDKPIDAYRDLLKGFYKKVDKELKVSKKQ